MRRNKIFTLVFLMILGYGNLRSQTTTFNEDVRIWGKLEIRGNEFAQFIQGPDIDSRGVVINDDDFGLKTRYRIWANGARAYNQIWYDSGGSDFFSLGSPNPIFSIRGNGVGIGISSPTHKLEVNGTIRAKEVKLEATNWPDYVLSESYRLPSLEETGAYIKTHGHLPGFRSAAEYEAEGVNMLELNQKLLEKVEELTLHLIEKEKNMNDMKSRVLILEQALFP